MKIVFCGTPAFAVPTLEALIAAGHDVALVVSQPDRPVGRSQPLTAPPVKQTALAAGIPVTQPEKIRNNAEFRAQLEAIAPEAIVVVAYGRIIPPWMLALPRLGCINLHGSLLPKYRGAAPIQWAWPWATHSPATRPCCSKKASIRGRSCCSRRSRSSQNRPQSAFLRCLRAQALRWWWRLWPALADGTVKPQPQNHEGATFAPLLDREDGRMDFAARTAHELLNRWRGFQPWPGAFTTLDGKKLIAHRMQVAVPQLDELLPAAEGTVEPGTIRIVDKHFLVACAMETWLELVEVQLEGKKRMSAAEFLRGNSLPDGARLGA